MAYKEFSQGKTMGTSKTSDYPKLNYFFDHIYLLAVKENVAVLFALFFFSILSKAVQTTDCIASYCAESKQQ